MYLYEKDNKKKSSSDSDRYLVIPSSKLNKHLKDI